MREKVKNIFRTDIEYKENTASYTKADGILALLYYLIFLIVYYCMGKIYLANHLYLGIACNIGLAVLCVIFVLLRKQKINSLAISLRKAKQAVILGSILGICMVLFNNVIPAVMSGCHFNQVNKVLYGIFYYFVIIAFAEEIAFRGYIQTRIYGLIKKDSVAVIVVGIMFSFMHIPFQMALAGSNALAFIGGNVVWLILLFFWHILFNFLHRKYNNILTNTIFHGFMDLGNNLFV
ncbi:CPBP family intramembrane glutamic endopeptidase [Anaerocolumna chitinilytica]|uniref:CAAX prenyl protease 2/Lysostaphin resistance protein A-like domain-containing protein n=1 Tax=Anaerocolumna chitinilytica TaxID=1727145 RepID=A0A7I8DQK0_9FIRM|nr:CPBP family intramembrane glutamic endopeptidase [Anaerocolumna chitinilytica]BCK00660.1 hypothetical protein bsdcttw_37000 [Anaerocolumna chitinilytica]